MATGGQGRAENLISLQEVHCRCTHVVASRGEEPVFISAKYCTAKVVSFSIT